VPEQAPTKQRDASAVPQRLKPNLMPGHTARLKAVPFPIISKLGMNNPDLRWSIDTG
jgi:hypothetical protein